MEHFTLLHLSLKYCNLILHSTCEFLVRFVFKSMRYAMGILAEGSRTELMVLGLVSGKSSVSIIMYV